ncbi:Epoxide hydrolase [Colletotrichum higginsianum IMI 349063]|uniref:Epoxide hydrolase n=1 Tax=Colletotrichum higginsianum (strain IMI 349063) TaxID=759273 RepID=A0A1B7XSL0_COLHI|nr:Epoxide hydrolase [Colletotrichum higginsianum IMI 349063]OBR02726.1 Epoxide hydrolase [Colletotrichum higginsianum IMI 349063]
MRSRTTLGRSACRTPHAVVGPSGELAINVSGKGLNFNLLEGVTEDTPLLSKTEIDYYVDSFTKLNWEDELALVLGNGTYTCRFLQPALFIAATLDLTLPLSLSTGMETYFDNLSRREVNGLHWMRWEKPAEVETYVGNWLTSSVLGNSFLDLNLTTGLGLTAL